MVMHTCCAPVCLLNKRVREEREEKEAREAREQDNKGSRSCLVTDQFVIQTMMGPSFIRLAYWRMVPCIIRTVTRRARRTRARESQGVSGCREFPTLMLPRQSPGCR